MCKGLTDAERAIMLEVATGEYDFGNEYTESEQEVVDGLKERGLLTEVEVENPLRPHPDPNMYYVSFFCERTELGNYVIYLDSLARGLISL